MKTRSGLHCLGALCAALGAGCLAQEQIAPPADAVVDEAGVAFVRLENPIVGGNVYLTVEEDLPAAGRFMARRLISPDGAFLSTDRPGVLADPWVWSDAAVGGVPVGAPSFVTPSVSLPMGGSPVLFSLHTKRGRVRTEPLPPGTVPLPLGFAEATVDTLSIALDPRVLVVPVRIHHFVRGQGRPQVSESALRQFFDPGAVATEGQATTDDGFASRVSVVSGRLFRSTIEPDAMWTQCDIQFHLEEYEPIIDLALATRQATSCVCGSRGLFGPSEPISTYLPGRDGRSAVDLFIGGTIAGAGCPPSTRGITCGPSNSGLGGSCSDTVDGHDFNVVLIDASALLTGTPNLLSHELGHMMGLRHPGDGLESCLTPDDTDGVANQLMFTGGGDTEPVITPAQCGRARCIAARWLEAYGRFSAAQRAAVCGE